MEILFSSSLSYALGSLSRIASITKRELMVHAFGSDSRELEILDIAEGKKSVDEWEKWACIMDVIWRKPDKLWRPKKEVNISGVMHLIEENFEAENVYALMMFLPVRIYPKSEKEALRRLLKANRIDETAFLASFGQWLKGEYKKEITEDDPFYNLFN